MPIILNNTVSLGASLSRLWDAGSIYHALSHLSHSTLHAAPSNPVAPLEHSHYHSGHNGGMHQGFSLFWH